MKLYRFRSLATDDLLAREVRMLNERRFWCSRFWELNDPMEGVYRSQTGADNAVAIFSGKVRRMICSFSGARPLRSPLMWGYYASGFKGMAIEVDVQEGTVQKMRYTDAVASPDATAPIDRQVDAILCNKLKPWKHEDEYRFMAESDEHSHPIGRISAVIIGTPYPRSLGYHDHDGRMTQLHEYRDRVRRLAETARRMAIRVDCASMRDAEIQIDENGDVDALGAP